MNSDLFYKQQRKKVQEIYNLELATNQEQLTYNFEL